MRSRMAAGRGRRHTVTALCVLAAAGAAAVAALPGPVAAATPAGAGPASAALPALSPAAATTYPPSPAYPDRGWPAAQVLPLSVGRPVPSSWPRPHALVRPGGRPRRRRPGQQRVHQLVRLRRRRHRGPVHRGHGQLDGAHGGADGIGRLQHVGGDRRGHQRRPDPGRHRTGLGPQGVLYYAWYEMLPAVSIELGAVQPGDRVTVDIARDEPGTWSISVDDSTEHSLWTGSVAYSAPEASAEWIEEAPTDAGTGNVEPLADYGSVQFSDMGSRAAGRGRRWRRRSTW